MQLGLKWNVKVALKRCLLHVNPTRHTYCSHHARLIILSLSSTRHRKIILEMGVRCGWRVRQRHKKVAKQKEEKSGGGSKSGDRKITA